MRSKKQVLAELKQANKELAEAVAEDAKYRGGQLTPGIDIPVHLYTKVKAAHERVTKAEERVRQLEEELEQLEGTE